MKDIDTAINDFSVYFQVLEEEVEKILMKYDFFLDGGENLAKKDVCEACEEEIDELDMNETLDLRPEPEDHIEKETWDEIPDEDDLEI